MIPLMVSPATPAVRIGEVARRLGLRALVARRPDPRRFDAGPSLPVGDAEAVLLPCASGPLLSAPGHVLMSTSGTSGAGTACLHTVDALLRNAGRHLAAVGLTGRDTLLVNLPLYYSYAMVAQIFAAYLAGARVVISGPPFSPAGYRQTLTEQGVTHSSITPAIVRRLLPDPGLPDRLRTLTVGGDRLAAEEVGALLAARPHGELYLTYGLTEAGPRVSTLAAHAEPASRHGSVGLPLPGVRTWLRRQDELVVETDTALVRKLGGGTAATRTLLRPGLVATGDRFRIDDDGYLHFLGRLSDFVMVRGEKVSLTTVRQAMRTLPEVTHVRPVPLDGDGFDLEVAVAEPRPDTAERIRRELRKVLLPAERPRRIHVRLADPTVVQK